MPKRKGYTIVAYSPVDDETYVEWYIATSVDDALDLAGLAHGDNPIRFVAIFDGHLMEATDAVS